MSTRALRQRLARLELQEVLAFSAFLLRLSPTESRTWYTGLFDTLAARGLIAPLAADFWEQTHAEREAFVLLLGEHLEREHLGVHAIIRQVWHAWEQEHPV